MNVILDVDDVSTVISLVTSQVLDNVELSQTTKDAVRDWRRAHDPETLGLDEYAAVFNEALGNLIDEHSTRMLRRRGKVRVSAAERRRQ
ncbi:MAG: hypothetical protein QF664_11345 [Dehalococcoidia bacterium]|jgi:hypothetical protein|nr:hypothetical protein [Dehalococcoidia bacterium]